METNVLFALSLTVMAGLATGIGSIIALFAKTTNTKFLAGSLGFSAGVMIYVSMIEIFQKSRTYIASATNDTVGYYIAVVSFFVGILLIGLIDYFVPSTDGDIGNLTENETRSIALKRMGFMTALAIGIHNFPEGLATFTSALKDPHLGLAIAVAIAIHNIPEGMAVGMAFALAGSHPSDANLMSGAIALAVGIGIQNYPEGMAVALPLLKEGISKKRAFLYGKVSAAVEPLFGVIAAIIAGMVQSVMPLLLAFAAGTMIYVVVEELIPEAHLGEKENVGTLGFVVGFLIMMILDVALG